VRDVLALLGLGGQNARDGLLIDFFGNARKAAAELLIVMTPV